MMTGLQGRDDPRTRIGAVFMIARHSSPGWQRPAGISPEYPALNIGADRVHDCATLRAWTAKSCGTIAGLSCALMCSTRRNGRPAHRFSINSSPTESNGYQTALYARFAACAAAQPLQGDILLR